MTNSLSTPAPPSILLADDHVLFRDAMTVYLERALPGARVKCLDNLHQVMAELMVHPDYTLVLLDWHMPGVRDVEDLIELVQAHRDLRFVLMSGVVRAPDVWRVIEAGFCGYLPKTMPGPAMIEAIHSIINGEQYVPLDPETGTPRPAYYADRVATLPISAPGAGRADDTALTPRELDTLRLLLQGKTNQEIADQMTVAVATVKMHLRNAFDKLGVRNRTEAAIKARELGLVDG